MNDLSYIAVGKHILNNGCSVSMDNLDTVDAEQLATILDENRRIQRKERAGYIQPAALGYLKSLLINSFTTCDPWGEKIDDTDKYLRIYQGQVSNIQLVHDPVGNDCFW